MEKINRAKKKPTDTPCRWTPDSDFDKRSTKNIVVYVKEKKKSSPLRKRLLPRLKVRSENVIYTIPRKFHNLSVYQPQLPLIQLQPLLKKPVFGKKLAQKKKHLSISKSFASLDISIESFCMRSMVIDKMHIKNTKKYY